MIVHKVSVKCAFFYPIGRWKYTFKQSFSRSICHIIILIMTIPMIITKTINILMNTDMSFICFFTSALSLTFGKLPFGISLPKKRHNGSQPWSTENISNLSAGIWFLISSMCWLYRLIASCLLSIVPLRNLPQIKSVASRVIFLIRGIIKVSNFPSHIFPKA